MPNCMCAFRPHKTWIHAAFWPRARLTPSSLNGNLRIWSRELLKGEQVEFSLPGLDQRLGFGCESRFSLGMPQSGKTCSMEYATKTGLCRRLSRRVNIIASKHPVKAPSNASVIDRLLKDRSPWPVRRNPVYAIVPVQRISRTAYMEDYLSMNKYCRNPPSGNERFSRSTESMATDILYSRLLSPASSVTNKCNRYFPKTDKKRLRLSMAADAQPNCNPLLHRFSRMKRGAR